jgi:hypothetical protein
VAEVQVRCPNSGLWASTGVEVEPEGWDPKDLVGRPLTCAICGERHEGSTRGLRVPPWA